MVRGFTRFKEGDNDRGFPDGRDVGRLKGKVVEFGEVGEGRWTKVFKMEDSEAIGTNGSGIRGEGNGFLDHGGVKRSKGVVQGMFGTDLTD